MQILQPKTVAMMTTNQIGDVSAGRLKTFRPTISSDVDFHPAGNRRLYLRLSHQQDCVSGWHDPPAAWRGRASRTRFYWIDPKRSLCAVVMMQFFPFVDTQAVGLLSDFEKAVYAS